MIGIWELTDDPKIKTKILAELEKRGNNLGIIGSKSGEIVHLCINYKMKKPEN